MAPSTVYLPASYPANPIKARFVGWVLAALALHALLLLISPRPGAPPVDSLHTLSVSLRKPWRPEPRVLDTQPAPAPQPEANPEPIASPPPAALREEPERQAAPLAQPAPAPEGPSQPSLSTAHLLDSAKRLQWRSIEPDRPRRLGESEPRQLPPNWRSGLPEAGSRFDGRALPERIEIVDRWLAADGSHHVLVQTPAGEMLCGRASAWDPMQPLVEPVMMFRRCGPAASTFEWPKHYRREPGAPAAGNRP